MEYEGYTTYAAMDVVLTARLWDYFQPWLDQGSNREVYELEMEVRRICTAMEIKGMRVDMPYVEKTYNELTQFAADCEQWALTEYDLRIGSTMKLSEWIVANGGVIDKFTPGGKPQVDVDMLTRLSVETSTPEAVRIVCDTELKRRHAQKIASSYLANFDRYAVDGVVHPDINTLAAITGRMSITNPALQTLHRNDTAVRDAFIPHNEDEVLVTCDSDQIEARLFANFSGDRLFQHAFSAGDFFVNLARMVYSDTSLIKSDPRRATIKSFMYGRLYGAGVAKLALTAKVPVAVMKDVADKMKEQFPGIDEFQDAITSSAVRDGYIETPLGRRLYIADRTKAYVAVNYLLQGHAAECLKRSIVNCDNRGIGGYLLAPVHDELIASTPRELAYEVKNELEECMLADDDIYPVPLTAGAEGPFERWGDKLRAK
jgi:DNA polymerase-1